MKALFKAVLLDDERAGQCDRGWTYSFNLSSIYHSLEKSGSQVGGRDLTLGLQNCLNLLRGEFLAMLDSREPFGKRNLRGVCEEFGLIEIQVFRFRWNWSQLARVCERYGPCIQLSDAHPHVSTLFELRVGVPKCLGRLCIVRIPVSLRKGWRFPSAFAGLENHEPFLPLWIACQSENRRSIWLSRVFSR